MGCGGVGNCLCLLLGTSKWYQFCKSTENMNSGFFPFWSLGPAPRKGQAMAGGRDVRALLSQT